MGLWHLFVVNKSGGLMYYRDLSGEGGLVGNDALHIASTFHGLHAIASQVSPVENSGGIHQIESETFSMTCHQTLTGIKFLVVASRGTVNVAAFLKSVYLAYSDYVMKNPFYEIEMPIRCERFDTEIKRLIGFA